MTTEDILIDTANCIGFIALDRPKALNALSTAMLRIVTQSTKMATPARIGLFPDVGASMTASDALYARMADGLSRRWRVARADRRLAASAFSGWRGYRALHRKRDAEVQSRADARQVSVRPGAHAHRQAFCGGQWRVHSGLARTRHQRVGRANRGGTARAFAVIGRYVVAADRPRTLLDDGRNLAARPRSHALHVRTWRCGGRDSGADRRQGQSAGVEDCAGGRREGERCRPHVRKRVDAGGASASAVEGLSSFSAKAALADESRFDLKPARDPP